MSELFHDLQVEQEEKRSRLAAVRKDREQTNEKLRDSIRKKQAR